MAELILRLHDGDRAMCDVIAVVEPAHTVAELTAALAARLGRTDARVLRSVRLGRDLEPDVTLDRVDLLTGDQLVVGAVAGAHGGPGEIPAEPTAPGVAVMTIDLVAGPDSGRSHRVRAPGRCIVGRSRDVDVRIDDRSVSRHHATIELTTDGTTIVHPRHRAANGVVVNGVEIAGPTRLESSDVVGLGATRLVVRPLPEAGPPVGRPPGSHVGRVDFHRTPYRPPVVRDRATSPVGPIPELPEARRVSTIAAVAPLAAGVAMFLVTRQLQFLALTLISPVAILGSTIEDRRSGRRAFRDRADRFRRCLVEERARFVELRDRERRDRFCAAPDVVDLIRRAELRTIDLWPRGREAPDFLSLRLGLGPADVRFAIALAPGGDDELRDEATAALAGLDRLADVPVTVGLDGVLAVHGERSVVDGVIASLVVQAAVLHSPEDLTIAAAVAPTRRLDWIRWLPHARSVTSPLSGDHLASTTRDADRLAERLLELAARRSESADRSGRDRPSWPRVVAVLDAELAPDPAQIARVLDLAPAAGIAVVWVAGSKAGVPRQATQTLAVRRTASGSLRGRLWSTDPAVSDVMLEVEHLRPALADRAARALAPIRDASTVSLATMIPRTAPLLDVLCVGRPSASWVIEQWQEHRAGALRFPIGTGADGPVVVDLVEDGPHTLIGGTSGAGKSELLQSMVASLAAHHPPTRLNFLFVDYKGGAASQVFERLPHTVGYVTNLSAHLAARALTSLRAELQRRMALLEGRAKDLAELLAAAPDEAPASLVIVVDEFATLVREVPDFVTGIVDIAQRGRSLGIHLVLATQRPTGAVNENILANTNLRISLRMLDRSESMAVVGVPDAADIPVPLRGRGIVRLGPRHLVEFQSAYGGAPLLAAEVRPPVLVGPFASTDGSPVTAPAAEGRTTQLAAVLAAIADADRRLRLPAPRRPWCDVLPEVVGLDAVLADPAAAPANLAPGRCVAVGLVDAPERQEQHPAIVDLEDGGGLLVFGAGGSGTTTLLRTVAASASRAAAEGGGDVAILAIDAAGRGLSGLAALPSVVEVVPGDDLEAVTRYLLVLESELARRRAALAAAGAEHVTAFARDHGAPPARLLLLVDGFGALIDGLLDGSPRGDEWVERLVRLAIDGRAVGVHAVLTTDRRASIPARVHAAIANRIILRHSDDAAYGDHGIPAAQARGLVPGRGWWVGPSHAQPAVVQVASVAADATGRGQAEALAELGARLHQVRRPAPSSWRSLPLPERTSTAPPPPSAGLSAAIGVADVTGAVVVVDLDWSHAAICGPPRSGRSTALAAIVAQLANRDGAPPMIVGGPTSSPLRSLTGTPGIVTAFGHDLAALLERGPGRLSEPWVLVVDDLDALDDPALAPSFDRLARDESMRLVVAMENPARFPTNPLVALARRARRLLVLQPDDPAEFLQVTGVRLAVRPGLRMPPGRGVLLVDRVPTVVQVTDALAMARPAPEVVGTRG